MRYRQENYKSAIPFFKEALDEKAACETNGFAEVVYFPQAVLNATALCYEKSGSLDTAIIYYKKGLNVINLNAKKFPEQQKFMAVARAVIYGNLGGVYAKSK